MNSRLAWATDRDSVSGWVWWYTSVVSAFDRQRLEDQQFKIILHQIVNLRQPGLHEILPRG